MNKSHFCKKYVFICQSYKYFSGDLYAFKCVYNVFVRCFWTPKSKFYKYDRICLRLPGVARVIII